MACKLMVAGQKVLWPPVLRDRRPAETSKASAELDACKRSLGLHANITLQIGQRCHARPVQGGYPFDIQLQFLNGLKHVCNSNNDAGYLPQRRKSTFGNPSSAIFTTGMGRRARQFVRAGSGLLASERRARSDAPYQPDKMRRTFPSSRLVKGPNLSDVC